jgi:hypothetical protein
MSEAAFVKATADLVLSVDEAFKKTDRPLPAFILLYSAIDILSSLTRPSTTENTSGLIFKTWVKKYMIAGASVTWTEADVWGARCGILHTFTVQSDLSRGGSIRELHYISDRAFAAFVQVSSDLSAATKVVVCLPDFISAFIEGVTRFAKDVQTDAALQATVFGHATKLIIDEEKKA